MCPKIMVFGQDYYNSKINGLIIDQERNIILTFSDNNIIKIWNLINGSLIYQFIDHIGKIMGIYFDYLDNIMISYADNGELFIWDFLGANIKSSIYIKQGFITKNSFYQKIDNIFIIYYKNNNFGIVKIDNYNIQEQRI